MDINKKIALGAVCLIGIVILLVFFIYYIATKEPEIEPSFNTNPLPIIGINGSLRPIEGIQGIGGGSIQGTTRNENPIPRSTLTIINNISPFDEIYRRGLLVSLGKEEVAYRIRYDATWSKETHPTWFPAGAHVSPMVAWSAIRKNSVFKVGEKASVGMEEMAETGSTTSLLDELMRLREDEFVLKYTVGSIVNVPESDEVVIIVSPSASLVSVVSMVAPSPDWFIAAHNIPLYKNGVWKDFVTIDAVLYDAGTDAGEKFKSLKKDSDETITRYRQDLPPLASFQFIRIK